MKKLLSIILSMTMLLSMATVAFANNSVNAPGSKTELYTFGELTNISPENVMKIEINYNTGERILAATESASVIEEIVDSFKEIQFWKDDTAGGGAGGWLYFINFYMKDGSYIQYGTSLHIDKVTYKALNYEESTDKMAYYYDLLSNNNGIDGPMQKAKIKVGTSADFKPFEYYDENGELTGFDIDLMKYIGEKIGFDIEFVNMSFDKLIPAVVNGEVDCAISGITITKERESVIDYTTKYLIGQTEIDGEIQQEQYAIVFPDNYVQKAKVAEAAGQEFIYTLVNDALKELIEYGTVNKLIGQYELNKATDETGYSYFGISMSNGYYPGVGPVIVGGGVVDIPIDEETADYATSGSPLAPPSDWATADVKKARALNITTDDVIYRYRMSITREEFCELIYNYCANVLEMLATNDGKRFTDTDNPKIEILSAMGIINGKTAMEFAPNDALTREEAATILNRLINVGHPGMGTNTEYITFADSSAISDWAMSSIQTIYKLGIMKGVGNNNFAPKDNYTTEQAIVTLVRVYASSGVSKNDVTEGILYKNEKMNVQFEIPVSWQGKYLVDESVEDYIVLKHTAIAEKYEGAGAICSVYKEPDETVDATLNMLGNQTVVWQNQEYAYIVGRPTDVQHPIWVDRDDEDSVLASEYEEMAEGIAHIISTFSLINEVDVPVITNVENMSYAQIRDLQRQVNNGHYPWRLDYEQVVKSFLSGKGINVEGGKITVLAGGADVVSLTYSVEGQEYKIELFKPIDTSEHGIWIVRTFEEIENE